MRKAAMKAKAAASMKARPHRRKPAQCRRRCRAWTWHSQTAAGAAAKATMLGKFGGHSKAALLAMAQQKQKDMKAALEVAEQTAAKVGASRAIWAVAARPSQRTG